MSQKDWNPFPNSDSNKRYYTYEYYLRKTFGGKVAKLPLDGGFTCPNRDGTRSFGGCTYCSGRGSGDFAPNAIVPIRTQIEMQKQAYAQKWDTSKWIAYFQAYTGTYAPLPRLKELYEEAIFQEGIVGLNIATRPDCLPEDVVTYLGELAERTVLTVELGLQSSNDATAKRINRGHTFKQFCNGFEALRKADSKIRIGVHLIFGLPGETKEDMLKTMRDVAGLHPDEVKIHLLHVIRDTALAEQYLAGEYEPMKREDYIETVVEALELLPPETVIGRLTGDGAKEDLIAPEWSLKKTTVLNDIDKMMFAKGTYQGKKYADFCKK